MKIKNRFSILFLYLSGVVVVYHVTIVAIGHGLLKKFWPFGTRLRSPVEKRKRSILKSIK